MELAVAEMVRGGEEQKQAVGYDVRRRSIGAGVDSDVKGRTEWLRRQTVVQSKVMLFF